MSASTITSKRLSSPIDCHKHGMPHSHPYVCHELVHAGGLIWTGDSHCLQGNGEVNLTALECSYKEIEIQPIVRKDLHIDWPRAETTTYWIFMGFDEDLNEAMKIAVRETVDFLAEQKMVPMSREEAYSLTSIVGDCRVSQVVDIRKGVHCMIPKSIFTKK
jgi:acetamidase/formamidase